MGALFQLTSKEGSNVMNGKEKILSLVQFVSCLIGIAAVSIIFYWSMTDAFFVADDFVWIERAKYLAERPLSIFRSEGLYFDPLVYILFRINYILGGLNPQWYHLTDLFIHAVNAGLVFTLAMLLTESKVAAFFSGLIFAVWPTNADSVLWLSSRVDTLSSIFFLSSIISYILYQRKGKKLFYCLSLISFVVALSAKSTPIILPFVIISLEMSNLKGRKDILHRLLPFFLISITYLFLLFYNSSAAPITINKLNIMGPLRAVTVLFFPESIIATREIFYMGVSVLLLATIAVLNMFFAPTMRMFFVTFTIIASVVLPVVFLNYATAFTLPQYVLASICHRLYLAVAGFSILMGATLTFLIKKIESYRVSCLIIQGLFIAGILIYGYTYIKEREQIWREYAKFYKLLVAMVKNTKSDNNHYSNISKLYLVGFPYGFMQPISRLYLGNHDLSVNYVAHYSLVPDIKGTKERIGVWVLTQDVKFADIREEVQAYQEMKKACRTLLEKKERDACVKDLSRVAQKLNVLNDLDVKSQVDNILSQGL